MRQLHDQTRRYWQSIGVGPLALVLGAVCCTFSVIGFVRDISNPTGSFPRVVAIAACSGLSSAIGFAIVTRRRRWLAVALVVIIGSPFLVELLPGGDRHLVPLSSWPGLQHRLTADGTAVLASVMLGYGLFLLFIATEGRKHLRIETEMALARSLQQRLVPAIALEGNGFEAFGRSDPSSQVGGDLLDLVPLKEGLFACVADVTGHGIPAGVLMGMVKAILRAELPITQSPGALLSALNAVLPDLKEPNVFVTAAMLRLDANGAVDYALAGHPSILHFRNGEATPAYLSSVHPVLGVLPSQYQDERVVARPGDLLVLLSDGLIEVFDRHDEEFGLDRLAAVIGERFGAPLPEVFDAVISAARRHGPQLDDQTLLLIRVKRGLSPVG